MSDPHAIDEYMAANDRRNDITVALADIRHAVSLIRRDGNGPANYAADIIHAAVETIEAKRERRTTPGWEAAQDVAREVAS